MELQPLDAAPYFISYYVERRMVIMKPDYILFTDGSSITEPGKTMQYAAYAFLVINNTMKISTKKSDYIGTGDSARAELFAIYNGLKYVLSLVKKGQTKTVLVLSDSSFSISLIEKHLIKWYDGHAVKKKLIERFQKDSDMFAHLAEIMNDDRLKVIFVHVKSHLDTKKKSDLQDRIRKAGYLISDDAAVDIIRYNRVVDVMAKKETKELAKQCGFYSKDKMIKLIERDENI